MELVYLWVEDYKNIKKQGFNFSPKFECKYDEDTKELTINKKEHIKDFFGKNINLTAIVGENGSGKSAILSSLPMNSEPLSYDNNILVSVINNVLQIHTKRDIKTIHSVSKEIKFNFEYISGNNDFLISDFIDDYSAYFYVPSDLNNSLFSNIYVKSNVYIDLHLYMRLVNKLIYKYSTVDSLFNYKPNTLLLSIRFGNIKSLFEDLRYLLERESLTDSDISNSSTNVYKILNYYLELGNKVDNFLIYIFLLLYEKDKKCVSIIESLYFDIDLKIIDIKKELFKFIQDKEFSNLYYLIEYFDNFIAFFQDKENFEKKLNIVELKNKYPTELDLLFQQPEIQKLLKIEFYDINDISFKDLSQGERQILITSLAIYDKIQETDKQDILILLDEPDLSLHPEWQKKYLNRLVKILSQIDRKIHLVLTSHSPFILSDLPKENVIFLEKGKQVYPDINPFGANIHTLLSHGFFMKDGLMGEFAKGKIEDVINYLNDKVSKIKNNDEAQKLIHIIGEPIIKNQLQRMLDSKRLSKVDKIDEIQMQINQLTQELEKLK